jgi:hypothetical protein
MTALVVIESIALLLLTMLVAGLLRSHADILRALDDLGVGRASRTPADLPDGTSPSKRDRQPTSIRTAPDLRGHTIDGESIAVAFSTGDRAVLAFLSATCHSCERFWQDFTRPELVMGEQRLIIVVQGGDNLSRIRKLAGDDLLVVVSDRAWSDYDVPGSPHFVFIDGGAVTGEGTGTDWQQVNDLLRHAGAPGTGRLGWGARDNAARIDRELTSAGILPGHSSLYPDIAPDADRAGESATA